MTIWFGSDPHFYHTKVIEVCNRPFTSIEEMNESFYKEADTKIKEGDVVYLLGDISFAHHKEVLQRLRGHERNIHLIIGNHDNNKYVINPKYWSSLSYYKEIKINDTKVVLCHYPIESWNKQAHGSLHFHGHTHNNASHQVTSIPNRVDVGYDNMKQFLSSYEEIKQRLLNNEYNY